MLVPFGFAGTPTNLILFFVNCYNHETRNYLEIHRQIIIFKKNIKFSVCLKLRLINARFGQLCNSGLIIDQFYTF
jgi:hypothetical protein